MDDFDDISNVLDDLADFDLNSFSTPAPTPSVAQTVAAPKPIATPAPSASNDLDLDMDMDFGMDFAPPTTTNTAPAPVSLGLDDDALSLNDIIDTLDFGLDDVGMLLCCHFLALCDVHNLIWSLRLCSRFPYRFWTGTPPSPIPRWRWTTSHEHAAC